MIDWLILLFHPSVDSCAYLSVDRMVDSEASVVIAFYFVFFSSYFRSVICRDQPVPEQLPTCHRIPPSNLAAAHGLIQGLWEYRRPFHRQLSDTTETAPASSAQTDVPAQRRQPQRHSAFSHGQIRQSNRAGGRFRRVRRAVVSGKSHRRIPHSDCPDGLDESRGPREHSAFQRELRVRLAEALKIAQSTLAAPTGRHQQCFLWGWLKNFLFFRLNFFPRSGPVFLSFIPAGVFLSLLCALFYFWIHYESRLKRTISFCLSKAKI